MMEPFNLQTREMRKSLEIREKPYYVQVTASIHLGYRKSKSITRWLVRKRTTSGYRTQILRDAVPDDRVSANGSSVLSYQQAIIWAMNMQTIGVVEDLNRCGFCGKSQTEVNALVQGPVTYICNECIVLCGEIIFGCVQSSPSSLLGA
jgi:hypothetical protein